MAEFTVLWLEVVSPLTNAVCFIKSYVEELQGELLGIPKVLKVAIFHDLLWTDNNNVMLSLLNFLLQFSYVLQQGKRDSTLNSSSVALSPVMLTALMSSFSSSSMFLLSKIFRAVTMIIMPLLLKSSGIQNVRVFPDPVGKIMIQSLCSSCARAAQV